ncbi:MAG: hypothetical protein IJP71_02340 [Lachnospiraceae bacterium]|nr:hypothetical protein [Lachnospiraceae bacterium]
MKTTFKVKIENTQQLNIALQHDSVKEIILSRDSFAEKELPKLVDKIKSKGKSPWILMERISRYEEKPADLRTSTDKIFEIKNLDGIIIQNLDSFAYTLRKINKAANEKLKVELNYTMNCYNAETKLVHENLYNEKRKNAGEVLLLFTAPVELNIYELSEVGYDTFIVYSYIDTMVTANCLRKNLAGVDTIRTPRMGEHCEPACKNRFNFENVHDFSSYIIDRKGKKLHYKTYCKYCYNKIFNTEPLYLLDKIDELNEPSYRIDFSFETENEVRDILNKKIPESFTRGHFKNSIK